MTVFFRIGAVLVLVGGSTSSGQGAAAPSWSTYLGGTGDEQVRAVVVDTDGSVVVAGVTSSPDFPDTVGITSPRGDGDVFVARLSADGGTLLWSAVLGGSFGVDPETMELLPGDDIAIDLAVDAGGIVTVMGVTGSEDFPTTVGAFDRTFNGGIEDNEVGDTFVLQLDTTRTGDAALVYSTYLGGDLIDSGFGVAVDASGAITVAGHCHSENFPITPDAFQPVIDAPIPGDAFVTRLRPDGNGAADLVWSTYLGGGGFDYGYAMALDPAGRVVVAGQAGSSADFPVTPGAYDTTHNGAQESFVALLDPSVAGAAQLVYSTYLGGSGTERATSLAWLPCGDVVVGGITASFDFPVEPDPGAFATALAGLPSDGFVTRLSLDGNGADDLVWSTYLGGAGDDELRRLEVRPAGLVTATGITSSPDFPVTAGAFRTSFAGGLSDGFLVRLSADGTALRHGTYLGGGGLDRGLGLGRGPRGNAVVGGTSSSADFPTTPGAHATAPAGGTFDAFVTRLCPVTCAFAAQVTSTGRAVAGAAGAPVLAASGSPTPGNAEFTIELDDAATSAAGTWLVQRFPGTAPLPGPGKLAAVRPTATAFVTDAQGHASLPLPLGCRARLCGAVVQVEARIVDPTAPGGVARTRTLTLRIGF